MDLKEHVDILQEIKEKLKLMQDTLQEELFYAMSMMEFVMR
jgi:hypothetical protein